MKIAIFNSSTIHLPAAGTNRCIALARGLRDAGNDVQIICLDPAENGPDRGLVDNIPYTHVKKIFTRRIGRALISFCDSYFLCKREFIQAPDISLALALKPWQLLPMLGYHRIRGIPIVQEYNEYPFPYVMKRSIGEIIFTKYYLHHVVRKFAGLALMTRNLEKYFQTHAAHCPQTVVIPMTVELDRFCAVPESPFAYKYIAYCGHLGGDKDGVPILIQAFSLIAAEFPDHHLVLVGDCEDEKTKARLMAAIVEGNVSGRVILTGQIKRNEVPAYLCNADVLALARPPSLQAEGGFPTKLGEYLATGRPVVVTLVGEIGDYLKDGEHAFMAIAGDAFSFAAKLGKALNNKDEANRIGRNGREVAETVFHYRVQGKRLSDFMYSVIAGSNASTRSPVRTAERP